MGYACFAFFMFGVMGATIKIMTESYSVVEIIFYRNILTLAPLAVFMLIIRHPAIFRPQNLNMVLLRGIVGALSMLVTFLALSKMPYSSFTVLLFTSTLLTPLLAHHILKERIERHRKIAIAVGMCGILIIIRPDGHITALGGTLTLLATIIHSFVFIILRYLKKENPLTVTFYFVLIGAITSGLLMPWFAGAVTLKALSIFFLIGVLGGIAQYALSAANKYGPTSLVVPFNYTGIIWATGFDILIWHHTPGWPVYLGAAIIIGAKAYIIHREHIDAKQP